MNTATFTRVARVRAVAAGLGVMMALLGCGCAARGHVATPEEITQLKKAAGLSASGTLTLSGPKGRFSARVVFGLARPDSLRIEIPAGTGLRFLLLAHDGRLRADLPGDDAMFEGASSGEVMNELFGIDLSPTDLVGAILGSPSPSLAASWRFDRSQPAVVTLHGANGTKLVITLDDPNIEAPPASAFDFGPRRPQSWSVEQMSDRLGLRR